MRFGKMSLSKIFLGVHHTPTTFAELREEVRKYGDAQQLARKDLTGLIISDTWTATNGTTVYDAPMRVVDVKWYETEDGRTVLGAKCQRVYAMSQMEFDAREQDEATEETAQDGIYYYGLTGTSVSIANLTLLELTAGDTIPYGNYTKIFKNSLRDESKYILTAGYNNYAYSALRQYLNSSAAAGAWWAPSHIGDSAPSNLSTERGYVAGCSANLLAALSDGNSGYNKVKIKCGGNNKTDDGIISTVADTFFVSSATEMYGSALTDDGTADYYWQQESAKLGVVAPSNNNTSLNLLRKTGDMAYKNIFRDSRLRTSNRATSYYPYMVVWDGTINPTYYVAVSNIPCNPCCVIY